MNSIIDDYEEPATFRLCLNDNDVSLLSTHVIGKEQLVSFCQKVRNAFISCDNTSLPAEYRDFPEGVCGDTSLFLAKYLSENSCGNFEYVNGWCKGVSHAWLEQGNIIIDVTADQFDNRIPNVLVTICRTLHDQFSNIKRSDASFDSLDIDSKVAIIRLQAAIAPYLGATVS